MIENFKDRFLPEREVLGSVQFSFGRGRGWVVIIFINYLDSVFRWFITWVGTGLFLSLLSFS